MVRCACGSRTTCSIDQAFTADLNRGLARRGRVEIGGNRTLYATTSGPCGRSRGPQYRSLSCSIHPIAMALAAARHDPGELLSASSTSRATSESCSFGGSAASSSNRPPGAGQRARGAAWPVRRAAGPRAESVGRRRVSRIERVAEWLVGDFRFRRLRLPRYAASRSRARRVTHARDAIGVGGARSRPKASRAVSNSSRGVAARRARGI